MIGRFGVGAAGGDEFERRCRTLLDVFKVQRDGLRSERRALRSKEIIFALLGGALSCTFAPTYALALAIGLAWPVLVLGLKSAEAQKEAQATAVEELRRLDARVQQLLMEKLQIEASCAEELRRVATRR